MTRISSALLLLALAVGPACESDSTQPSADDTSTTPDDTSTTPDDITSTDDTAPTDGTTAPPDVLTPVTVTATVGPEGGTLAADGFAFIVPEGGLATETTLTVTITDRTIADATLYSPVLSLEPAGLVFEVPATIRFELPSGVTEAAIFLSQAQDPTAYQSLDTIVADGIAQARVPHFSTVYVCDPNNPGGGSYFCCKPLNPATHAEADCVMNPANGVSCDPDICSVTPGVCPDPRPDPGCPPCVPIDPQTTPPDLCLFNPTNAAVCDPDLCKANPACAGGGGGGTACDHCSDPTWTAHPDFAANYPLAYASWIVQSCAQLAAFPIPPGGDPTDPYYWAYLSRFCSYQQALSDKRCGSIAANQCELEPTVDPCDACTDQSYWANPDFVETYDTNVDLWSSMSCSEIGTYPVVYPESVPPSWPEAARFCGRQQATANLGCQAPDIEPVCDLTPTADPCDLCADAAYTTLPDYIENYAAAYDAHIDLNCAELGALPVVLPSGPAPFWGEVSRFCAQQQAIIDNACAAPEAEALCDLPPTTGCASGETQCADGTCVAAGAPCPCAGGQVQCPDGTCVASLDRCGATTPEGCAALGRFFCPDSNRCVASIDLCPCAGGATRCQDGSCVPAGAQCADDCTVPCEPIDAQSTPAAWCASNPANNVVCDPDLCQPKAGCQEETGCCAFVAPASGEGCSEPVTRSWCESQNQVQSEPPRFYPATSCFDANDLRCDP